MTHKIPYDEMHITIHSLLLIAANAIKQTKSRIRELFLIELPSCECGLEVEDGGPPADELGKAVNYLRETCREGAVRIHGVPIPTIIYD